MDKVKFVVLMLVVIGIVLMFIKAGIGKRANNRFRAKPLMTANELEFYKRLREALPEFTIFCQVAMSALLEPTVDRKSKDYMRLRGRIAQKYVDFVLWNEKGGVIAIIELDDRTHNKIKDQMRDAMLHAAGYMVIRWQSHIKPTPETIAQTVADLMVSAGKTL